MIAAASTHTPQRLQASREHEAPAPLKIFHTGGRVERCIVKNQETESLCELIKHVPVLVSGVFFLFLLSAGYLLLTTALIRKTCALSQEHIVGEETS